MRSLATWRRCLGSSGGGGGVADYVFFLSFLSFLLHGHPLLSKRPRNFQVMARRILRKKTYGPQVGSRKLAKISLSVDSQSSRLQLPMLQQQCNQHTAMTLQQCRKIWEITLVYKRRRKKTRAFSNNIDVFRKKMGWLTK